MTRTRCGAGALLLMLATQGCYTYSAASAEPAPGTRVAYTVTDRGRVALAEQVGPGVARVEGTILQNSGSSYLLAMSRVRMIDGSVSRWAGERVTLSSDNVANAFERRFSRKRTAVAVGATIVGVAAFIITRNLIVSGVPFGQGEPRNPVEGQ